MNKFAITLLGLAAAGLATASPLTPGQALSRFTESANGVAKAVASATPRYVFSCPDEMGQDRIHAYSNAEGEGFLFLAADDNTAPLLGYCDSGSLPSDIAQLPDGLQYWLSYLAAQVSDNSALENPTRTVVRKSNRAAIKPLINTKWNQSAPYNNECPLIGGQRAVTGCVATAFAQVLKYYNYPTKGQGSLTYTDSYGNTYSMDFSQNTYAWDYMLDSYSGNNYTSAQARAVSTLMHACGVGVKMNYSPSASGAQSANVADAMIDYFGYDKGARCMERDYFLSDEWEDMVYSNLRDYGPVAYSGHNGLSGHEFVCDGYDGHGYFHFNWGWGGMSDGWFLLNALDPGAQGIGGSTAGYNCGQDIVTHVSTQQTSAREYERIIATTDGHFNISTVETTTGTGKLNMTFHGYNVSRHTLENFAIGVTFHPVAGGTPVFASIGNPNPLEPTYGWKEYSATTTMPELEPGTYRVRESWRDADGVLHDVLFPTIFQREYMAVCEGNTVNFHPVAKTTIVLDDLELASDLRIGSKFQLTGHIRNEHPDTEYSSMIWLALIDEDNHLLGYGGYQLLTIPAGETQNWESISTLHYDSTPSPGEYTLAVVDDAGIIISAIPVTLKSKANFSISSSNLYVEDGQDHWNITATATVKCTSGYYAGNLTLYLAPSTGGTVLASFPSEFFSIQAPGFNGSAAMQAPAVGQKDVTWNFNFSDAEPGQTYLAGLHDGSQWISNYHVFTLSNNAQTGISVPEDAVTVEETEYYTLTGQKLGSRPEVHGLYIMRQRLSDGTVKTTRIML